MGRSLRYSDPTEDALYEALCLNYWGAHENARHLVSEITEAHIKKCDKERRDGFEKAKKEATSGTSADENGQHEVGGGSANAEDVNTGLDIDWDDAAGHDQYPWDGWRFKND